jgi:hypothetical protein
MVKRTNCVEKFVCVVDCGFKTKSLDVTLQS